jgi:hypothetical protein
VLFSTVLPLLDHFVVIPGFRRRATTDAEIAKLWFWKATLAALWATAAIGVALWIENARSWIWIGLSVPTGWRAWSAVGVCGLFILQSSLTLRKASSSERVRSSVRKQFNEMGLLGSIMPTTNSGLAS